jgi:Predicted transcriptional regulator
MSIQIQQAAITHRLLRMPEVQRVTALPRTTIYVKLDEKSPYYDPTFPKPITLGARSIAWVEAELQEWIASCVTASRKA